MERKQFQSLVLVMTLLNRYYSLLRMHGTAIPEAVILCEAMEELLAPRFIWVEGVYRWPNTEPVVMPDGSKKLSQAGCDHHWLVLNENRDIVVDALPVLGLKGFETPLILEQQSANETRAFIGYFPNKAKKSSNGMTTVTLEAVRSQMDAILKSLKI